MDLVKSFRGWWVRVGEGGILLASETGRLAMLSPNAKKLFVLYVEDSGNWGGSPMVGGNVTLLGDREDRGLLTHLKRAGLITTFKDGGNAFVEFTDEGRAYAVELGLLPPERWS